MDIAGNDAATEQFALTLPPNLVAQIDAQVGSGFVDRQEFIRSAVRHYLAYLQSVNIANNQGTVVG